VKDTKVYTVQMVNGQQQKTEVSNQAAQQGGREGRLKEHVVQKEEGGISGIRPADQCAREALHDAGS
jgi:hypothetical protein